MKNYYLVLNIHNPFNPTIVTEKNKVRKFNGLQAGKYVLENYTHINPLVALEIKGE